ncbi:MAG: hypothetical protein AB8E82_14180 [Aureispira sp.]
MIKKIVLLTSCFCCLLMACNTPNDEGAGNPNGTAAKGLAKPEPDLEFAYMLYDNDYNAVPVDQNPTYYTNKVLDSALIGLAYQLTNEVAFAPGLSTIVKPDKKTTWYHLGMRGLKLSTDMQEPLSGRGFIVFSWERAGNMVHYTTYPINELLEKQNRHMVDKWETIETWHQVPSDVQQGDLLKVYVWNPEGGTIYLDDLIVTAWQKPATWANTPTEAMRLLAEQSYEHEVPSLVFSNKYAYRGTYSNVVGNLEGYNAFGKTYLTTLEEAQLQSNDVLRIRFAALKQDRFYRSEQAAVMVCSVERNGVGIYWESLGINSRLWKQGQQVTQDWKELTWWQPLPDGLQPTDVLKVYAWNDHGTLIYVDDLSIEVLSKAQPTE